MHSIIVEVKVPAENGSDVFDVVARMMTPKEADKFVPKTSERMRVPEPHLSYDQQIAAGQEAKYNKKVEAMKEMLVPIQLFHGKTGREEGFYVVTGEPLPGRMKLCVLDGQKKTWSERKGYEWDGPYMTLEEAKLAATMGKGRKAVTA